MSDLLSILQYVPGIHRIEMPCFPDPWCAAKLNKYNKLSEKFFSFFIYKILSINVF